MVRLPALFAAAFLATAGPALADSLGEVRTGNTAFNEGRYEAAVEAYTRAVLAGDLDPEALAVTFNNRGVAYSELGDYDRAIQDYTQSLSLKPKDKTAIKNLRIAYVRRATAAANLGEQAQALADYNRAIELEPDHPLAYVRRAQLRLQQGDRETAIPDLEHAQALEPNNREIAQLLSEARGLPTGNTVTATIAPSPEPPTGSIGSAAVSADTAPAPDSAATAPVNTAALPSGPEPAATRAPSASRTPVKVTPSASERPINDTWYRARTSVNFRAGPGNDFPRVGSLASGTEVRAVGVDKGWLHIKLKNGKEGYVFEKWMEPVSRTEQASQ